MVSVIIPIYNAEKYLERCLESLKNQSYSDYEVLMMDDGSEDSSSEICKKFVEADKRFCYHFQNNSGVSFTRNAGLRCALGNYITFIDADDWVEPDYIERLLSVCKDNSCDIVLCSRIVENGKKSFEVRFDDLSDVKCENTESFIPTANHLYGSVWGGIYTRSAIQNVWFDESIHFGEDMVFISTVIKRTAKIGRINEPLYHYSKNANDETLSKGRFSSRRISNLEAYRKTAEIFKDNKKAQEVILGRYCDACAYFMSVYYQNKEFRKEYYRWTLDEYRKNYIHMIRTFKKSWIWRVHDFFLLVCPEIVLKRK